LDVIRNDAVPAPDKRYNNILCDNFGKVKHVVVIFAKQQQESKEKLIIQQKSISTNQYCYFILQKETLSEALHNTKKGQNSTQKKQISLLLHT